MPAALAAAHIGHQIEHSSALMGFLIGAVVGLAIGVAIVATVATGGAALAIIAAVGGAVAATGGGALAGKYIGEAITSPKGPISTGSPNVFYGPGRIAAARAVADTVDCTDHGKKFIATGSDSVFINVFPAARTDDKSECDGTIKSQLDHIFIGAETAQYLEIQSEVPEWMVNLATGMVIVGTAVALVFGAAAAFVAGSWCALGTFALQTAGGLLGAAVLAPIGGAIGEALGGELGRRIGETAGGILGGFGGGRLGGMLGRRNLTGHPVDVATGEMTTAEADFTIPGIVALQWRRSWMSSSTHQGPLGSKWHHTLDIALAEADGCNLLRLGDGRLVLLPQLAVGQSFWHRAEQLLASRTGPAEWVIRCDDSLLYRLASRGEDPVLRLAEVADSNGNVVRLDYDADGRLAVIHGSDGLRYPVDSDTAGRITQISRTDGAQTQVLVRYAYDNTGDLVRATDAAGQSFAYAYDRHLLVRETRRSGLSFHFVWDDPASGTSARCVRTWGDGGIYLRALDYLPGETRVTNGKGAVEVYHFNTIGLVTQITSPMGAQSSAVINRFGETEATTDPNGAVARHRRDAFGRPVEIVDPAGAAVRLEWASDDAENPNFLNIASRSDAAGGTISYEYDARGNLTAQTDEAGHRTHYLRDPRGLTLAVQDDTGVLARYSWSAAGRLVVQNNSRGGRVSYRHDSFGRVVEEQTEGEVPVRFELDALDRPISIAREGEAARVSGYSPDGMLDRLTEPDGTAWHWDFAGLPFPVRRRNPDGTVFTYGYDVELNLTRLTNEAGDDYRLAYDLDERLVEERGFDGYTLQFSYDPAGHLTGQTDGRRTHRLERDAAGRLIRRDSSDGGWASFAYDPAGRMVLARNAVREVGYQYDPRGLMVAETQDGIEVAHGLSARGHRTATMLPDGRVLQYDYDADGSLQRFHFDGREVVAFARDRMGRETLREGAGLSQQTDYDPQGRIRRQLAWRGSRGGAVISRLHEHDPKGRMQRTDDLVQGSRQYRHDALDQLRAVDGAQPETFYFDPAGMIAAGSWDGRDASIEGGRLLMRGDCHYDYDDAGNRIAQRRGAGGSHQWRYEYDAMNQLVAVHELRGRAERTTTFAYDALGRRVSKRHREVLRAANDAADGAAEHVRDETTWFLWDNAVLLAEGKGDAAGAGDPLALVYVHEPGSLRPMAQIRRTQASQKDEVLVYWLDHMGTPLELSNERGELVWQVALKAWGGIASLPVERVQNNIRFLGQYHDVETGLHYNRYRHYDPDAGAFINPDPIRLAGGEVLARYVPDPLAWADPFGLDPDDWNRYQRENAGRGWTPAQMSENYRNTVAWRTNNPVSDGTHGNSLATTKPAVGYVLVDRDTGAIRKFGETTRPVPTQRYTQAYYTTNNVRMIVMEHGTKAQMHQWQHRQILDYMARNDGKRPALNFCNY